jgi:hypothetical protein
MSTNILVRRETIPEFDGDGDSKDKNVDLEDHQEE